jgi:DNA-binding beta-propeller fold protein YncE
MKPVACAVAGMLVVSLLAAASATTFPLKTIADVPLSGASSRMDYESFDPQTHMLFIAHMGAGQVIAFDTVKRRVAATIDGTPTVRGVLAVPSLHRVYAAARGSESVVIIDEHSFRIIGRVSGTGDVDGLAYDPRTNRLFVSDEAGGNDVVIDTRTNRIIAKIALGGEAGNTQDDPSSRHIFVAVQTRNQLVEIDPRSLTILARYDLLGCEHGHGVAIDTGHRTAYVACEGNNTLVEFDLRNRLVVAKDGVGDGPDVLSIDPLLRRLYVASESGVVSVFDIHASHMVKIAETFFAPHAHVVDVDAANHNVFFPLQDVRGRPVVRIAVPS